MNNNLRHLYLSLLLLAGIVTPATVAAAAVQEPIINRSGFTNDRLMQIETAINSQGQLLYQLQQQLSSVQQDINILRGQTQETQYKLSQFVKQQKDLYAQLDLLRAVTNKVKANINSSDNNSVITTKIVNEKTEYDTAVALAIKSKSKQQIIHAINSFQRFIKTYPKSNYQSNANYWLGQLNYNQGNRDNATFYFATVVKNYPNSTKMVESLYKVGLLMQEKGQNNEARFIYQQLIKEYPGSSSAKLAEKKLALL